MQTRCLTCTFTLMQMTKKMLFHACAYVLPLHVLICYVNTCLQRDNNRFVFKNPGLSVDSEPRTVLRDK